MRRRQRIGVFVAFEERQIGWSGEVDRGDIGDGVRQSRGVTEFGAGQ
jgi:hypothetical protein